MKRLCIWYNTRTSRQRNILRLTGLLLSAVPIIGWVFVAPWMIPLMLYLEYHLTPLDTETDAQGTTHH
jgi:hypothetical protein